MELILSTAIFHLLLLLSVSSLSFCVFVFEGAGCQAFPIFLGEDEIFLGFWINIYCIARKRLNSSAPPVLIIHCIDFLWKVRRLLFDSSLVDQTFTLKTHLFMLRHRCPWSTFVWPCTVRICHSGANWRTHQEHCQVKWLILERVRTKHLKKYQELFWQSRFYLLNSSRSIIWSFVKHNLWPFQWELINGNRFWTVGSPRD